MIKFILLGLCTLFFMQSALCDVEVVEDIEGGRQGMSHRHHDDDHYDGEWYPLDTGYGSYGIQIWDHPRMKANYYDNPSKGLIEPRVISNVMGAGKHGKTDDSPRKVTSFLTAWSQFITHDIVYTPEDEHSPWDIKIPAGDPFFDPYGNDDEFISFERSRFDQHYGSKYKLNLNTPWIDGSQVYGNTKAAQKALRAYHGGLLKVSKEIPESEGEFPPFVYEVPEKERGGIVMDNDAKIVADEKLFLCGDLRANENPLLTSMHVLFLREHNRVARKLHSMHQDWNDETLYQKARKYVIAEIQQITFEEYLYWLLARKFPVHYKGFDGSVDPSIHIFFSTVAFRYAHSEIGDIVLRARKGAFGGFPLLQHTDLKNIYSDPQFVYDVSPTSLWVGLANHLQQSVDTQYADAMRNWLFVGHHKGPKADLMSLDLQRSRDHCIPLCNDARRAYGLKEYKSWDEFNVLNRGGDTKELLEKLKSLYKTPYEADALICGLAEDWVETKESEKNHDYSNVGELFEAAIISQFNRIRAADKYWYLLHLDTITCNGDLIDPRDRTLASVVRDNSPYKIDISDNVFVYDPKDSYRSHRAFRTMRDRGDDSHHDGHH